MRRWILTGTVLLGTAALLLAVTVNGDLHVLGTLTAGVIDFRGAAATAPVKSGTALPAACEVGQAFFKTDAQAGQNLHLCTAANTWTPAAGGGGSAGFDWRPSSRFVLFRSDMAAVFNQTSPAYLGDIQLIRATGSTNLNVPNPSIPFLNPGIASITTTSTAGNRIAWWAPLGGPASADAESLLANSNRVWELEVIFRFPAPGDYANSSLYLGLMSTTTENPPRGVALRYLAGTDATFRLAYANQNSWGDSVDTGVAPDTNWHRLRIRSDGTVQNRIWLRLDNGPEYSGCPTGCQLAVPTFLSNSWSGLFRVDLTTSEAAVKTVQLDYLHFWLDHGAQR